MNTIFVMKYNPLSYREQEKLLKDGNYKSMIDLKNGVDLGMKGEVLNSYGEIGCYVITCSSDRDGLVVAKTEIGVHSGEEVCLDSSMSDCYDIGWKFFK